VELANTGHLAVSDRELLKLSGELYMYKVRIVPRNNIISLPVF